MYAELHTQSALSLLGGASLPEKLVERSAELGYEAIALTDQMDMGGVVRFAERARELGIQGILGAQILLRSTPAKNGQLELGRVELPTSFVILLARTESGYRNICRLITRARMETPRDRPAVDPAWLPEYLEGVVVLDGGFDGPISRALRVGDRAGAEHVARWMRQITPKGRLFLEAHGHDTRQERRLARQVDELGQALAIPRVVTGNVRFSGPEEKPVYDLLTCVKHRTRLSEAGTRLLPNREWHLQSIKAIQERWRWNPELVRQSKAIAEQLEFRFENLKPKLPSFPIPGRFESDDEFLAHLTWEGARIRYPNPKLTLKHRRQIEHELNVIKKRGMAGYFLISWDIARFCRSRGILAQGRGSAANSAVCYCLLITAVDPIGMKMLFERFLSEGREEYPDIDIDISHEWREEAIQYVYERYGRDRAALVCEQICYRGRSAVRDAAWALGFEQDQIDRLAGQVSYHRYASQDDRALEVKGAREAGIHEDDPRVPLLGFLVRSLQGIPRHRSIHVGGMVLTADPLCEIVPIEPASMSDRTVIQWEKDDLPFSGLAKFDLLGLGALSLLQKALVHISKERKEPFDLASIPPDDPEVYDALCRADTLGVFQIESRAQMSTLPRLKPRCFYDLVVEIALIRPGPIQGKMVHPYLRRRDGREPVDYLHPALEPILERTLGVPIFQEQVMKIAIELAGFSPAQADGLRRAMGFRRYSPKMEKLRVDLHRGMTERGVTAETQEQIVAFLTAFGHYGFPESHSASFALLAYASSWLKVKHAPLFAACLINSQPMGFYSVGSIIHDARVHEVECRPPDLRFSEWDCTLEPAKPDGPWRQALRVGLRCVDQLGKESRSKLEVARAEGPFESIRDIVVRTGLGSRELGVLAQAGAFDGFVDGSADECSRREALWSVLREARIPTTGLARFGRKEQEKAQFESLEREEVIIQDYVFTGLSTNGHPMENLRPALAARGVKTAQEATEVRSGEWVRVAGMVIVRQRPSTAKGFTFVSMEDETGISNVIVSPQLFGQYRAVILSTAFLEVQGIAQVTGATVQIKARRIYPLDGRAPVRSHDFH